MENTKKEKKIIPSYSHRTQIITVSTVVYFLWSFLLYVFLYK